MASLPARTARTVSRSWSSAVAGISRSLGASSSSSSHLQHRSYSSDEGLEGRDAPPSPEASPAAVAVAVAVEGTPPLSGELPSDVPNPTSPFGSDRTAVDKSVYPPRNYRTPRGVYKAIVLGEVGQLPIQKILKSGRSVTIFSVGTGGMYNNRRPFEGESPEEFAERSYTQWHRVAVYQDRVASMVMQHVKVGSQVYLEGNIESRVYNDPNSGIVKRIREIAIRTNGRLMFMDAPIAKPFRSAAPSSASSAPPTAAQPES